MSLLQAQAFRGSAAKKFKAAKEGGDATAIKAASKVLLAAYDAEIVELRKQPALGKQLEAAITAKVIHHERYEKKTVETADPPASSAAPMSSEGAVASAPASSEEASGPPSTARSAPASEEVARKTGKKGAAGRKSAESEDDAEEKALMAAFAEGDRVYRRDARRAQVDAVGYRGPLALLRACQKPLKTTSIAETFGALQALPAKLAASSTVEAQVSRLAKNDRASRVDAMLATARREGKAADPEARKYLRAEGIAKGTAHLKGMLAVWPAMPVTHPEVDAEQAGAPFAAGGRDALPLEPPAEALVGLDEAMKAEVKKQWKEARSASVRT